MRLLPSRRSSDDKKQAKKYKKRCNALTRSSSILFISSAQLADQPAEVYKSSANSEPSVHSNVDSDNEKSSLQKNNSQKDAISLVHIYDSTSDYELSEGEVRSSSSSSIQTATAPHSPSDTIVSSTSSGISSSSSLDSALVNRLKRKPISLSDVQSIYEEVDLARSMDQQLIDLHKLRLQQQTQQFVLSQQRLLCPQQPPSKFVPASGIFVTVSDKSIVRPIAFKPFSSPCPPVKPTRKSSTSSSPFSSLDSDDQSCVSRSLTNEPAPRLPPRYILTSTPQPNSMQEHELFCFHKLLHSRPPMPLPGASTEDACKLNTLDSQGSRASSSCAFHSDASSDLQEAETLLREKNNEIAYLRETLEQNEQVIFKVCEEKESAWKRELARLRAQLELNEQTSRAQIKAQAEQMACQAKQIRAQQTQLAEQRSREASHMAQIAHLQQQLAEARISKTASDLRIQCTKQESLLQAAQQQLKQANERMDEQQKFAQSTRDQVQKMAVQLANAAEERLKLIAQFASEKSQWDEEKRKVIAYHKHLQSAQIKTLQQNKQLQIELQARSCPCFSSDTRHSTTDSKTSTGIQSALPVTCS